MVCRTPAYLTLSRAVSDEAYAAWLSSGGEAFAAGVQVATLGAIPRLQQRHP
jgi:hypothetical protein